MTALDAMPRQERVDSFEATSRVMDEHPEFVDEFYAAARHHPRLFDRFITNAAPDLKEKQLAEITARHLVDNPDSVEQVLATTMNFIAKVPAARAAMNRAMISRAEEATGIITDDPATVGRLLVVREMVKDKPGLEKALRAAKVIEDNPVPPPPK